MVWVQKRCGKWIYCRLMGLRFREQEIRTTFAKMPRDVPLTLTREPQNPVDPNAIRVELNVPNTYLASAPYITAPVGYLPREVAAELAPRMDADERFICLIVDSDPRRPCIRVKPHALQNIPGTHPWGNQLPKHHEDYELEERRKQTSHYTNPRRK